VICQDLGADNDVWEREGFQASKVGCSGKRIVGLAVDQVLQSLDEVHHRSSCQASNERTRFMKPPCERGTRTHARFKLDLQVRDEGVLVAAKIRLPDGTSQTHCVDCWCLGVSFVRLACCVDRLLEFQCLLLESEALWIIAWRAC